MANKYATLYNTLTTENSQKDYLSSSNKIVNGSIKRIEEISYKDVWKLSQLKTKGFFIKFNDKRKKVNKRAKSPGAVIFEIIIGIIEFIF